jgi:hypothetical protein
VDAIGERSRHPRYPITPARGPASTRERGNRDHGEDV